MPNFSHPDTITRWVATQAFGTRTFGTPTTLKGRWEDVAELFRSPDGEELTSQAKVSLESRVDVGDHIFKGESTAADPRDLTGAYEVRGYSEITDLRSISTERVAFL